MSKNITDVMLSSLALLIVLALAGPVAAAPQDSDAPFPFMRSVEELKSEMDANEIRNKYKGLSDDQIILEQNKKLDNLIYYIWHLKKRIKADDLSFLADRIERDAFFGQVDIYMKMQKDISKELETERLVRLARERNLERIRGSITFPGLGHYRTGEKVRGLAWGGGFAFLALSSIISYYDYNRKQNDLFSVSPFDYSNMDAAQTRSNYAFHRTNFLLFISAAVYCLNLIDAHAWREELPPVKDLKTNGRADLHERYLAFTLDSNHRSAFGVNGRMPAGGRGAWSVQAGIEANHKEFMGFSYSNSF